MEVWSQANVSPFFVRNALPKLISQHTRIRGRGFAVSCASAFIAHAIKNRLKPRWDCDRQNRASIRLAEKLGFRPVKTYSLFVGKP
ncbi:GNAT family N-acetyltransferase [Bacillus licheniformis]|uniref:GNAT family N-acetyltransferase n=1 Tax=Bacillus licheniformis TaxID=1402 RepID=UPI00237C7C68|nr:GNAT family N-acetyltransferase [Bacillus licheniformis]MDE1368877.1 GNAT family N-acetyltransferase [Bacillus licheniformis]